MHETTIKFHTASLLVIKIGNGHFREQSRIEDKYTSKNVRGFILVLKIVCLQHFHC